MNEQTNNTQFEAQDQPLFCDSCGAQLSQGAKFCLQCGKQISSSSGVAVNQDPKSNKKKLFLIGGIIAAVLVIALAVVLVVALTRVPVANITLSKTVVIRENDTEKVTLEIYPTDATNKKVKWTSSDETVATVDSSGTIKAVGKGNCKIIAQVGDKTETVTVTVHNIDFNKLYKDYCNSGWAKVGKDNSYLSIDDNPNDKEDFYLYTATLTIEEVNEALGLPESLYEEMLQTSWDMGKQTQKYEDIGIEVTWTYHPDKGLEVMYKLIEN